MAITSGQDVQIQRYLLGTASEEERAVVEQRLFEDDDYFEEIRAAELELVRDYLRSSLTADLRRDFEKACKAKPDLALLVESERQFIASVQPTFAAKLKKFFLAPRLSPIWAAVPAMAMLALVINVNQQNNSLKQELASARAVPPKVEVAMLTQPISADLVRGEGTAQRIVVPADVTQVRIRLQYPQFKPGQTLRGVLRTVENQVVAEAPATPDSTGLLLITIPANSVTTNDYILHLQSNSTTLESYAFTILKK